jgi:hypothetical protein
MKTNHEKKLRKALDELADYVGWELLNSLSPTEIKHSYSGIARSYNRAVRVLDRTRPAAKPAPALQNEVPR